MGPDIVMPTSVRAPIVLAPILLALGCDGDHPVTDTEVDTEVQETADTGRSLAPSVILSGTASFLGGEIEAGLVGEWVVSGPEYEGEASLLVGAPRAGELGEGAVYFASLPTSPPDGWSLRDAYTLWVGEAAGDEFGTQVCHGKDLTDDGAADLVISAPSSEDARRGAGAVYLLPGPLEEAELTDAITFFGNDDGDLLGKGVTCGADVDGDGVSDLLIGARGASFDDREGSGAAYLVQGPVSTGGSIGGAADVVFGGGEADENAGRAIVSADFSGDGRADLAISAYRYRLLKGRVYLVDDPTGAARYDLLDASVVLTGLVGGDATGRALAAGDVDGDGYDDLLVTAPGRAEQAGGAWLWSGPVTSSGSVTEATTAFRTWPAEALGGYSAVIGSVGDSGTSVVLGAPGNFEEGPNGTVWVWSDPAPGIHDSATADVRLRGPVDGEAGRHLSLSDEDVPRLLIGAPWAPADGVAAGGVFVWDGVLP